MKGSRRSECFYVDGLRVFPNGWGYWSDGSDVLGQTFNYAFDDIGNRKSAGTMEGAGGVGGLKALIVHNGTNAGTYFYSYDGNGNVAALVNATDGNEAARYEYGPFGERLRASGLLAKLNPFRFSTKYQDDATDLLYYGYRYLSTVTGRWLGRDPLDEESSVLLYGFVLNAPSTFYDALGMEPVNFDDALKDGDLSWGEAQAIRLTREEAEGIIKLLVGNQLHGECHQF